MFVSIVHLKYQSIKVKIGAFVKEGEYIGKCGNTGNSTQPHIHIQAIAIAPIDSKGYPDNTQMTVAYAGTNFDDIQNLLTDVHLVGTSKKYIDGQAASAQ